MPSKSSQLLQACSELSQSRLFDEAALVGWTYTWLIDSLYIDPSIIPTSKFHPTKASQKQQPVTQREAEAIFGHLESRVSPTSLYESLQDLSSQNFSGTVLDSFVDTPYGDFESALAHVFGQHGINVLIIGGGCTGLAMANALSKRLSKSANIIVVENRIHAKHSKQPYGRQWPTMIPLASISGLLDDRFVEIASRLGEGGQLGLPLNIFETLLLLYNKISGVRFLFDKVDDFSPIAEYPIDIVFDASGGRLLQPASDSSSTPGPIFTQRNIENFGEGYRRFGINHTVTSRKVEIQTVAAGEFLYPAIDGRPIKVASLKITQIPLSCYQSLIDLARHKEYSGKLYVWPGRLRSEINSILLIVNLTKSEYISVSELLSGHKQRLSKLVSEMVSNDTNAEVLQVLLQTVLSLCPSDETVLIESPFVYQPYLCPYQSGETFQGKPLLRIGDSTFNGNPKTGNGLTYHLTHIRRIIDAICRCVS